MGVAYRALGPLLGRTAALKTISINTADPQARAFRDRLYREAAAAGARSHPNIVTIFGVVEDRGMTAVAMECIEGRSLAAIIAERAPFPTDLAVEILGQIGSALDYAGSEGLVHRDIKPADILNTSAGRAKVTDVGAALAALATAPPPVPPIVEPVVEPVVDGPTPGSGGAAAAAVRQWTFRPARKDGQPVPCWFNVGVPFPPAKQRFPKTRRAAARRPPPRLIRRRGRRR